MKTRAEMIDEMVEITMGIMSVEDLKAVVGDRLRYTFSSMSEEELNKEYGQFITEKENLEVDDSDYDKCICDLTTLMNHGCKCGGK